MNPELLHAIGTPSPKLIEKLNKADSLDIAGHSIKAISITDHQDKKQGGGFNTGIYLYQRENGEYRVLKVLAEKNKDLYGGAARKIKTFNEMYQSIYEGEFSTLATAEQFYEASNIIDMPFINGDDVKIDEGFDITQKNEQQDLYKFFDAHGLFITDYRMDGNIVRVTDSKTAKSYFLIRDVDLLGRKNSLEVTPTILEEARQDLDTEEYQKLKAISGGVRIFDEPKQPHYNGEEADFFALRRALLQAMTANKINKEECTLIASAKNFPELCDRACQHETKPGFFDPEITKTMNLLRVELKKDNYHNLKSFYNFQDKMLNIQLRSIGATSQNFINNTYAQDKNKLATARTFFRHIYYPEFDSQSRETLKPTLNKRDIFNKKNYIDEVKTELKKMKDPKKEEQIQKQEEQIQPFKINK
ncbi:hypothetical protein [Legionella fallonii]|uniref:Uncharacterized protein n=1 Tax=Legionella fallonii LLAP-10 TaxID=1212491 RepID=A0A098G3L2_9GAMM|nr:hypothetical protein [Legionella fallonii]CEG57062.1 protein of unknown function [Legionella fallonii LLAP-10]